MQIKFIFDIASPNAYLSHKVIPDFEKKYDVKFDYFVCLLGGIFKLSCKLSDDDHKKLGNK